MTANSRPARGRVSRARCGELRLRLTESRRTAAKRYTQNTEAYQPHLRGRYHWNRRAIDDLESSRNFQRATELDPNFALARAGLADSYHHDPGGPFD
jgi:hypothetical protein